jgi:hypothetical protein
MSQMTVSQMSITETTPSPQTKLALARRAGLNWSGLPVVQCGRQCLLGEGSFPEFSPPDFSVRGVKFRYQGLTGVGGLARIGEGARTFRPVGSLAEDVGIRG